MKDVNIMWWQGVGFCLEWQTGTSFHTKSLLVALTQTDCVYSLERLKLVAHKDCVQKINLSLIWRVLNSLLEHTASGKHQP